MAWGASGAQDSPAPKSVAAPVPQAGPARPGLIETARKLVELLHISATYDRLFQPLIPLMVTSILPTMEQDKSLSQSVQDELKTDDGKVRIGKIIGEELVAAFRRQYPLMIEQTAKEYSQEFTEDELQSLLAFYGTPVGAKALRLVPEITQKLQAYGRTVGKTAGEDAYGHIRQRLDPKNGI
jgi:hypothetical protein